MRREPREGSFSDYFTLGGHGGQPAAPDFAAPQLRQGRQAAPVADDVLVYLRECNFTVYPAPLGEGTPKYVYQGQLVTLEKLISIANGHRALRQLPPFEFLQ